MSERIVIVGASLAGTTAAIELRDQGFDGEIVVVGDEPHLPYDRPPLSKEVLLGERAPADVALDLDDALDVRWRTGCTATALDAGRRVVRLSGIDGGDPNGGDPNGGTDGAGSELPFDGLVVATGVRPLRLPPLAGAPAVHHLRTIDDSLRLRDALRPGGRLVVVGAGFIGVEVASAARARGVEVDLVALDAPLDRLGPEVGTVCAALLEESGVRVHLGRTAVGAGAAAAGGTVLLDDGTRLPYDALVVAIGSRPATEWLRGTGADLADGVRCDASLAVAGLVGVVAAGDVARWPDPQDPGRTIRVEHWSNAVAHGAAAARTLLHGPGAHTTCTAVPDFWSDHLGTRLRGAGTTGGDLRSTVVAGDPATREFVAAGTDAEGTLRGIVGYGMAREFAGQHRALLGAAVAR